MINIVVQLQLRLVCSAVSPGAPSCSLRGLTWSVILFVTRSPLDRHPDRYAVTPGREGEKPKPRPESFN